MFGNVVECNLKKDFSSGLSRGFAFVTFDDPSAVDLVSIKNKNMYDANIYQHLINIITFKVISKQTHILGDKNIDPKKLKSKESLEKCTKVFIGGVDPNTPESTIRDYFQQYGRVC